MKYFAYALMGVLLIAALASGGAISLMAGTHQGTSLGHGHGDDDQNETNDMNETQNMTMAAGGGGWFIVKNPAGMMFKDTFGFSLNGSAGGANNSSLVFQARDIGATIHAIGFDNITLDNTTVAGFWTAIATGTARAAGQNWSFRLQVTDMGAGSKDLFNLTVKNATMTLTWMTAGLGGGNITVGAGLPASCHEDQNMDKPSPPVRKPKTFMGAFGAGVFPVKNATGVEFNDGFGLFLDARAGMYNYSRLVFLAADSGMILVGTEFDKVWLDNTTVPGSWSAHAIGMAVGGNMTWSFELNVTDASLNGSADLFMLSVTSGSQTMTWSADGLTIGNIFVLPSFPMMGH